MQFFMYPSETRIPGLPRENDISREIQVSHDAIGTLLETIATLEGRLQPILRPAEALQDSAHGTSSSIPATSIGSLPREDSDRIKRATDQLGNILRCLEV